MTISPSKELPHSAHHYPHLTTKGSMNTEVHLDATVQALTDRPQALPPPQSCRRMSTCFDKLDTMLTAFGHLALIFDVPR